MSDNPAFTARASRLQEKMEKKLRKSVIVQNKSSDICSSKDLESVISEDGEKYESLFNDKYEIKEKTGEGAHGVVKKCIDRSSQEVCAVKTMKLDQ